ncbi:EF-hand domain-containing protein [Aspergillus udagawae]|uniref:EF-hand domain-containing protein n=1 Tax=Aspergillus udagawae TaxID=91492 RepID=A0A8E0R014_9EURO|nr:uncharacterized protein Aud_001838 [Aspergillus udagawae]GIC94509.1 hypothetical protein Aud_001838 [Aspergillus udagawae]
MSSTTDYQYKAIKGMGQKALLDELQRKERAENDRLKKACIAELRRETSDNVWYYANDIRELLAAFYIADVDDDGCLSPSELLEAIQPKGEEGAKVMKEILKNADIGKDQKFSLAEYFILGLLATDRRGGYNLLGKRF